MIMPAPLLSSIRLEKEREEERIRFALSLPHQPPLPPFVWIACSVGDRCLNIGEGWWGFRRDWSEFFWRGVGRKEKEAEAERIRMEKEAEVERIR